jgi:hypothetical protein
LPPFVAAGIVALPQPGRNSHMCDPADAGEHFVQLMATIREDHIAQ